MPNTSQVSARTSAENPLSLGVMYVEAYVTSWKGSGAYIVRKVDGSFPNNADLIGICGDGKTGLQEAILNYPASRAHVGFVVPGELPHVKFVYIK